MSRQHERRERVTTDSHGVTTVTVSVDATDRKQLWANRAAAAKSIERREAMLVRRNDRLDVAA
ncbi:hypothetical protein QN357_01615 [Cryobacterium sp. RTC2.1]|uniref:hypothetical protein n=1 Tax=Cryobacterium sp. RTC2.1 TaxID=3048634 RepID=UPI002B232C75|nr:hypothetical protein [Cryobacterium sp. RTC2.1]MEB0001634.1 hypothetical protein [Cryobacterium sp. RTC2.1]